MTRAYNFHRQKRTVLIHEHTGEVFLKTISQSITQNNTILISEFYINGTCYSLHNVILDEKTTADFFRKKTFLGMSVEVENMVKGFLDMVVDHNAERLHEIIENIYPQN